MFNDLNRYLYHNKRTAVSVRYIVLGWMVDKLGSNKSRRLSYKISHG
jgi:hypothetical protein